METQPQTATAGSRSNGDMAQNIQQLTQAGFDEAQVRALVTFVGDTVRNAVLPVMEHVDRRFDAADQRFHEMEKRMDQRLDDFGKHMDQRFDDFGKRVDQRFDELERRTGRVETRLDGLDERVGGIEQKLAVTGTKVDAVQSREWVALMMMGLGFAGIIVAIALTG